jgi:tRNA 2-thiouridine synthesizing protein D
LRYTLLISAAPQSGEAAHTAYRFAEAALSAGHSIEQLFFYGAGVHNASKITVMPQDEPNLPARWDALIREHGLSSTACVSSAIRRGVVDAAESARHELGAVSCFESSEIGGLGQLIDAMSRADRVVSFG